MPTLLTATLEIPPPAVPPRKRWTRDECADLAAAGLFEKERLELVDGELISKMGKNRPHVNSWKLMLIWLQEAFGPEFVDAEAPIDVAPSDHALNEPVPDLVVLRRDTTSFTSANPQPDDILLLVEIADSSLHFDRAVKAALYARAGIMEYWVLDVNGRRLFCHREPDGGRYQSVVVYSEHESLAPLAASDKEFRPAQAFPAA
jgi:Uma2 family endonuclease